MEKVLFVALIFTGTVAAVMHSSEEWAPSYIIKKLTKGDLRLVKSEIEITNGTGRVEVRHENEWGTICDKGWDRNDAEVVCSQLGFVKSLYETSKALYGQGEGKIWLSNVKCSGKEKSLLECPHDGWGNNDCMHSDDAGVTCLEEGIPQIMEVGCYEDNVKPGQRAMPHLYGYFRHAVDWYNLRSMISRCAEGAYKLGYQYFGIQFYGECWGSMDAGETFDKYGKSKNCRNGVGKAAANFVYRFAPWKDLGCWADNPDDRTMTQIANFRSNIDWSNMVLIVERCYIAAKDAGYRFFALQFYGECWVSNDAEAFKNHGQTTTCWNGVGQTLTNYVYEALE